MKQTESREPEEIIVGGQAVLEGVMMRSPNAYAVSVRRPDGTIASIGGRVPKLSEKYPSLKLPVLRGSATLIQAMVLGVKALNFSSAIALEEETEEVEVRDAVPAGAGIPVSLRVEKPRDTTSTVSAVGSIAFALVVNIVLFVLLPLALTNAAFVYFGGGAISSEVAAGAPWYSAVWGWISALMHPVTPSVGFNLFEGLIRVSLFVGMVSLMSRIPDMHRVFQYHGAEHKVVFAFEAGEGLTVDAARRQPRLHPRCGTSFLMVVMLVAVVLFSIVSFETMLGNALARILLVPLVAGLSYEVIRATARNQGGPLFRLMVMPGLWLQRITTQEPTDDQIEVAIHALEASLALEPATIEVK